MDYLIVGLLRLRVLTSPKKVKPTFPLEGTSQKWLGECLGPIQLLAAVQPGARNGRGLLSETSTDISTMTIAMQDPIETGSMPCCSVIGKVK